MMKGKDAFINIHEVRRPDLDPQLVAENIALQLERRVALSPRDERGGHARDADGRAGRQGPRRGTARRYGNRAPEWYREGRVPLQTLRADVAYGFAEARTTYGQIGVKVWIFRGEILTRQAERQARRSAAERNSGASGGVG